jgi:DNA mismatch endonuclease (patch repair protein)
MVEPLDQKTRDRLRKQKRRDTKPEIELRSELHRMGLRFRVDQKVLPGMRSRPDITFGPSKVAVFVDGCFWHRCPEHGTIPGNNREWWKQKLTANFERDRRVDTQLHEAGWHVLRFWEHEDVLKSAATISFPVAHRRPHKRTI